jgi:hypothetical protein
MLGTVLRWDAAIGWGEIVQTVAIVGAALAIVLTHRQQRMDKVVNQAQLVDRLVAELWSDDLATRTWYKIEYAEFRYPEGFADRQDEAGVDRLLTLFDQICRLHEHELLDSESMHIFAYRMRRTYSNSQIQRYLAFLDRWFQRNGLHVQPWSSWRRYCQRATTATLSGPGWDD